MGIRQRPSKKTKSGYVYEVDFYYTENGIKKRFTQSGFKTKKEAQEFLSLKQAETLQNGKLIKEIKKTFEEVYYEFLELGCDQYQYNTIRNTKNMFNMYLQKDIGKIRITQFDYATLQKYFNSLSENGIEKNNSIKKAINRVLNFAIKMDYIKNNPLNLITVKGVDNRMKEDKVLSFADFNRIIEELENKDDFKHKSYSVALQIGLYTGLRISEVLALDKSDIDFINDMIYVNKKLNYQGLKKEELYASTEMKSKSSNAYIPLADPLKKTLLKWFSINPYDKVLCDIDGFYINPNILGNDLKKITKPLGIHYHFHMLRHTFATTLVTNNVDIKTAQELMRHSNFNTTMSLYTHINDEKKKKTINDIFSFQSGEKVASAENRENLYN